MNLVLFGIYITIILVLSAFISIVLVHIGHFREYSKYLSVVLKLYIITMILVALFGAYMVYTGSAPIKTSRISTEKIDF